MALQTETTLSDEIKTFYDLRLLMRAVPRLVHGHFGYPGVIQKNKGGTIEWRRFDALSVVSTALTEGVTPASESPSITVVTATPLHYGAFISHSDELEMKSIDPIVQEFSDQLGEQCGRSIDQLTRSTLHTGVTTVVYPGTVSAVGSITAADVMDWALWSKAVGTLEAADASPFENGRYVAIVHPHVLRGDLQQDDTIHRAWENDARLGGGENPFRSGYVGTLSNVDVYVSSHANKTDDVGSGSTVDVYDTLFLAQQSYGITGIAGTEPRNVDMGGPDGTNLTGQKVRPVELIIKPLGSSGAADPLNMRATVAWKASHQAVVLNTAFAVRARHASALGSNS